MAAALLAAGIIAQQRKQLPEDFIPLASVVQRAGCRITYLDGCIEKSVTGQEAVGLREKLGDLQQLYAATAGCPYVVHATQLDQGQENPRMTHAGEYVVYTEPVGQRVSCYSCRGPKDVRDTTRCILRGLQALHRAGYGHGNICWENVICVGPGIYVLIDLEGAVQLSTRCQPPYPTAWEEGGVLVDGKYEVTSDLQQVANLIRQEDLSSGPEAQAVRLLQQQGSTAESVLREGWLSE